MGIWMRFSKKRPIFSTVSYLFPVYPQPGDLGVKIREVSTLKQWVVAETYARYDVTGTKGGLFNFREKLLHLAVED